MTAAAIGHAGAFLQLGALLCFGACLAHSAPGDNGRYWIAAGALALLTGSSLQLGALTVPLAAALDTPVPPLLTAFVVETRVGALLGLRMLLAALLLLATWRAGGMGRHTGRGMGLLALACSALLMASAGHAMATPAGQWTVALQTLHLAAAGLWAGLIMALLREPAADHRLHDRLYRVGNAAFLLLLLLIASGLAIAYQHGLGPTAVATTLHGRILATKLVVLTIALLAAAVNRFHAIRTPARHSRPALAAYCLRLEAAALLTVLLLAAVLARTPPPHGIP